jgi:hypothetical protein
MEEQMAYHAEQLDVTAVKELMSLIAETQDNVKRGKIIEKILAQRISAHLEGKHNNQGCRPQHSIQNRIRPSVCRNGCFILFYFLPTPLQKTQAFIITLSLHSSFWRAQNDKIVLEMTFGII